MVAIAPHYCHQCGAQLGTVEIDGRDRAWCPDCEMPLFRNAVPSAGVLVRDGDRVLLTERATTGSETWALPGGHPEYDEPPEAGAARELAEETGLRVDPGELSLHDVVQSVHERPDFDVPYYLIWYVVDRAAASGVLEPATDAADARFWPTAEALDDDRVRDVDREAIDGLPES